MVDWGYGYRIPWGDLYVLKLDHGLLPGEREEFLASNRGTWETGTHAVFWAFFSRLP